LFCWLTAGQKVRAYLFLSAL